MSTLAATLPMPYAPPTSRSAARAAAQAEAPAAPRLMAPGEAHAPDGVYHVLGDTVTRKVGSAQSGDAYALFEMVCPPGSAGPPPHRDPEDETFFVLEGALTLTLEGAEHVVGPGGCAFVPRGAAHTYANRGAAPARALVLIAPGAAKEALFAALDAWGRSGGPGGGPPDVRAVGAICAAHGVELLAAG